MSLESGATIHETGPAEIVGKVLDGFPEARALYGRDDMENAILAAIRLSLDPEAEESRWWIQPVVIDATVLRVLGPADSDITLSNGEPIATLVRAAALDALQTQGFKIAGELGQQAIGQEIQRIEEQL